MNIFLLQVNQTPITTQTQVQPQQVPMYPKQIKTEKEMKTLLLIPVILYTWLSLTHRDKIYHQIKYPTNKQKYTYLILQGLQIILLILLETVILRYT